MKFLAPVFILLFGASAQAQPAPWVDTPWFNQPLRQVREYLQLSDGQLQAILVNNDEYNRFAAEKQVRIRQVQGEIAAETGKEPLDPAALGIRYAEIEAICRHLRDRATEIRTRNLGVLTVDQKAKLNALEEAIKLLPVITEAQNGNLAGTPASPAPAFISSSYSITGTLLTGGVLSSAGGCTQPFPTSGFRTGDFTSVPPNVN